MIELLGILFLGSMLKHIKKTKTEKNYSEAEKYNIIAKAIKKRKLLNVKYKKNTLLGEVTYRKIKPLAVGYGIMFPNCKIRPRDDKIYVHAYCKLRKSERIFLLENLTILDN